MERPAIFFRVDANTTIGLGHVVRCIALAQMLQKEFTITFAAREIPAGTGTDIQQLGFNLFLLENEENFIALLKKNDIVVLDHYGLDSAYQKSVKDKGSRLVCIDDLHDKEFFADLIINHAPGIDATDYHSKPYTQFALGLDYVLLRPPFLNSPGLSEAKPDSVFVCFGGADPKNITQLVTAILKDDKRFKSITIVAGTAYQYMDELKLSIADDPRFNLFHSITPEVMRDLMAAAELAIVPASGILQEVLAAGRQVISGMYVENQKNFFEKYKALDYFISAEYFSKEAIVKAVDLFFKSPVKLNKRLVDGKSGIRLLKYFKQFQTEDKVLLREALESDLLKTFEWAANSEVRRFSFNKGTIDFEGHKKWFLAKLNDKHCFYYLGELEQKVFGSIRFDMDGNTANISYLVDPGFQNRGLGTVLLKKGLDLLLTQSDENISTICGEVLSENTASVKVFQKLGYGVEFNSSTNFVKFSKRIRP